MSNSDNNLNDDRLRQIASHYAELEGEKLKEELKAIENMPGFDIKLRKLDKKVEKGIKESKTAGFKMMIGIAAAVTLLILIPRAFYRQTNYNEKPSTGAYSASEAPDAENASTELIQVSFNNLPEQFTISYMEQDVGKTIYHIDDDFNDNVIMVVEKTNETEENAFGQMLINNKTVYAKSGSDYKLITFYKDGISYTLTCKYELGTIEQVAKSII